MNKETLRKAKQILLTLERNGHAAFFVGGCVRDQFLKKDIGDIDITTSASPTEVQSTFDKVIPVGIEHGTVIVRLEGESFEVTTFRVDGDYSDFRHPDHVRFVDRIDDDLARRDFTMNAIAMDANGKIVDPFMGERDIQNRVIRTVGSAPLRFQEDPLRMMRALRFASQLGFTIEEETYKALLENVLLIDKIAMERITVEMEKLFKGSNLNCGLTLFKEIRMAEYIPILKENPNIVDHLTTQTVPLHNMSEVIVLFHFFEPTISVTRWMKEWKLSNQTKNEANKLIDLLNIFLEYGMSSWLVYNLPEQLQGSLIRLLDACYDRKITDDHLFQIRSELSIKNRSEIVMNGQDIAETFEKREKGPWINTSLVALEKAIVNQEVANNKKDLREWLKQWSQLETD